MAALDRSPREEARRFDRWRDAVGCDGICGAREAREVRAGR